MVCAVGSVCYDARAMENRAADGYRDTLGVGKRILVADDTAIFRRALVRQLEILGMDPLGVDSLEELKGSLESDVPDAVLLDWHFGGRTAEPVLELLRARWIPAIVLTGDPGGVAVTGVPVLGKPVEMGALRTQLAEVLGGGLR